MPLDKSRACSSSHTEIKMIYVVILISTGLTWSPSISQKGRTVLSWTILFVLAESCRGFFFRPENLAADATIWLLTNSGGEYRSEDETAAARRSVKNDENIYSETMWPFRVNAIY